jgi:hypothetical protein
LRFRVGDIAYAAELHMLSEMQGELGMQLIVHIPDDMIEPVRDRLPPPQLGVLEAVALDAVLAFLATLETMPEASKDAHLP